MNFRYLLEQRGIATLPGVFKGFIFFGTIAVAALFMVYTQFLIDGLQNNVKRDVRMWAKLWELAGAEDSSPRVNAVIFEEIIQKAYFPIIVTDRNKKPVLWARIPGVPDKDTTTASYFKITKEKERMEAENGVTPVSWNGETIQYILYDYPPLVRQLQVMPLIEIGVVGVFLIVGFVGFRNIQRAEQRNIWVGMAKETAHQLGTPISSLMGWLELLEEEAKAGKLKSGPGSAEEIGTIVQRMAGDIRRLDRVADRFGQIGSVPETSRHDINRLIEEVVGYYSQRLPHAGKGVRIIFQPGADIFARVNPELFTWVIENLIKNSLQACDPVTGEISLVTARRKGDHGISVTVSDNGSGIPSRIQKKVFQTGFSTKKRGWGLGLTLARRICQEYHQGKIELRESVPRLRTTFEITLDYALPEEPAKGQTA
jgi:signal transduction histidine kinase